MDMVTNALRGVKLVADYSARSSRLRRPIILCSSLRKNSSIRDNQAPKLVGRSNRRRNDNDDRNVSTKLKFIPLVQAYEHQVSTGKLLFDPMQLHAAKRMMRLQITLKDYNHAAFLEQLKLVENYESDGYQQRQTNDGKEQATSPTELEEPVSPPPSISIQIPRGFYIHGSVGIGKSLLLNSFYDTAPVGTKRRRIHFHSFLQEIHQRIHDLNKQILRTHGRSFHVDTAKHRNPILRAAEQLSDELTLLCIDEFQVTDVADAMMLSQFFGELWRRGVVVVATSNRPPGDLYEGGLNREYFLPFVDLLERFCVVHRLGDERSGRDNEEKDYRRIRSRVDAPGGEKTLCGDYYHLTTLEEGNEQKSCQLKLDELFHSFRNQQPLSHAIIDRGTPPLTLQVHFQRTISISRYHSNIIARFAFDELCTTELGSSDYHAIANHFRIVAIEDIPRLTLKHPDRARRFITLIDELYEAKCCLVCTAADIPDRLFVGKATDGVGCNESHGDKTTSINNNAEVDDVSTSGNMHAVDVAQVQGTAVSELASVKELSFAFDRAASRLLEMCSNMWWKEQGVVVPSVLTEQQR